MHPPIRPAIIGAAACKHALMRLLGHARGRCRRTPRVQRQRRHRAMMQSAPARLHALALWLARAAPSLALSLMYVARSTGLPGPVLILTTGRPARQRARARDSPPPITVRTPRAQRPSSRPCRPLPVHAGFASKAAKARSASCGLHAAQGSKGRGRPIGIVRMDPSREQGQNI